MYLRHTTVSKNGKTRTYWRLVRSVRVRGKVRQQTVAQLGELDAQGRTTLQWSRKDVAETGARSSQGCYVLGSNVSDWTDAELWQAYMQLTEAEAAFRMHKSDLRLRPIWHPKEARVQAHILVCFLAYVLRKTLEGWSN